MCNEAFDERIRTPMSQRDKYGKKFASLLDKWNVEFDKLEAKIRKADTDPKVDYDEHITALRQQDYKAKAKLEENQKDSEGAWKDLKQGLVNTWIL